MSNDHTATEIGIRNAFIIAGIDPSQANKAIANLRARAWEAGWETGWKASSVCPQRFAKDAPTVNLYDNPHKHAEDA